MQWQKMVAVRCSSMAAKALLFMQTRANNLNASDSKSTTVCAPAAHLLMESSYSPPGLYAACSFRASSQNLQPI